MNIIEVLFIAVIAAVFADAVTTVAALRGGAFEKNRIIRAFVAVFGKVGGLTVSHGLLIAALVLTHPTTPLLLLILLAGFGRAVIKNTLVLRRL